MIFALKKVVIMIPIQNIVSKLDWSKGDDFSRPWVKIFLPNFDIIKKFTYDLGYDNYEIDRIWYQQYLKEIHGWHTHLIQEFIT